ncbi:hypothetical protein CL655_03450 [bacterium]|nr:hypothetical protein [bacterium]|tara:strand:+ start:908 stop:2044 length:1137 start_codon:yes stop_codon:yes gene_type:complete
MMHFMRQLFMVVGTLGLSSQLVLPGTAAAAVLYLDPNTGTINPGDTIVMAVRVNPSPGECINVVDAVIEYDPNVQPVDISRGQSILPLWVEEPTIDRENNRITFAGGIPNGYCGRIEGDPRLTNEVLKIVFQVPGLRVGFGDQSPTSTIRFSDQTTVYLNDGRGSLADLITNTATLVVGDRPGQVVRNDWVELVQGDTRIPEEFSITLQRDTKVFDNKYYIIFNTTDKQTGIAYYEVIEEPFEEAGLFEWGAVDAPWKRVRSPYVLSDQSLNSTIRVKAVDKAGNEYIATLVPEEPLRGISMTTLLEYIIIGVGALLLVLLGALVGHKLVPNLLARRRERKAAKASAAAEEDEYEYVEEWVEVEVDEDGNVIEDNDTN